MPIFAFSSKTEIGYRSGYHSRKNLLNENEQGQNRGAFGIVQFSMVENAQLDIIVPYVLSVFSFLTCPVLTLQEQHISL